MNHYTAPFSSVLLENNTRKHTSQQH